MKTVKIDYDNLYITGYVGDEQTEQEVKLPIKAILEAGEEAAWEHIHGYLSITTGEEKLGHLGFFGEDDVCFNTWIGILDGIIDCFSKSTQCRFLECTGEQGDPAFEFCRDNDLVYISYVDPEVYYSILSSEYFDSGRVGKESLICSYADFDSTLRSFLEQIKNDIFIALGDFASVWWEQNSGTGGRCSHIAHIARKSIYK